MPFSRPTLSELRTQIKEDVAAALPGTDPLLRYSNLGILSQATAGLTYLLFGYLDWIAQQAVPFTATGEYLEAWAALEGVFRIPAVPADGSVTFTGTPDGTVIPVNKPLVRSDGITYHTTHFGTVSGGSVTVPVEADPDLSGLTGAFGNCPVGTQFVLGATIAGINSQGSCTVAFTGGADIETDDSLRARMLQAYQNPPHGGDLQDYVTWALAVPGVTRAWPAPNIAGPGTVSVYFMEDNVESAFGGFPQGSNGVSQNDRGPGGTPRDVVATGDQLLLANALCALAPVTALVYAMSPAAFYVNFTINGIAGVSAGVKALIAAAITGVFTEHGTVSGGATVIDLYLVEAAIAAVPGAEGFVITIPSTNIAVPQGDLATLGTITYT